MRFLQDITKNSFIQQNLIYFVSSLFIGVLNFAYLPIMGYFLPLKSFGEVQTLLSLTMFFGIFLVSLNIITTNIIISNEIERYSFIHQLYTIIILFSFFGLFAIIFFHAYLQQLFHFESWYPFVALALFIPGTFLLGIRQSFLQGKQNFKDLSFAGIIAAGSKIIFATLLVLMGWNTFGAIFGIVLAQLLSLWYIYSKTKTFTLNLVWPHFSTNVKKELKYVFFVFFIIFALTFFSFGDILFIKAFFSSEQAGLYSAVNTLARTLIFVVAPLSLVLFSFISSHNTTKQNFSFLMRTLSLTAGIGAFIFVFFVLFREKALTFLFGTQYIFYKSLLLPLTGIMMFISITQILLFYYIALRKYTVGYGVLISLAVTFILNVFHREEISDIVANLCIGVALLSLWLIGFSFAQFSKKLYVR